MTLLITGSIDPRIVKDVWSTVETQLPTWFRLTPIVKGIELMLIQHYGIKSLQMTALTSKLQIEEFLLNAHNEQ